MNLLYQSHLAEIVCAKIYNFPLEKALNEERRMAYEERIYFVVADKRD